MRRSLFLFCAVCIFWGNVYGVAVADDRAAVRKYSERYISLITKNDESGLAHMLDSQYQVIGLPSLTKGNKAEAIGYWTHSRAVFVTLENKIESVRLFGDTAIETGALFATRRALDGSLDTWGGLNYTRVWVKDCERWRLVHEQY
jgi:ketosteroid isomerase-like protein